MTQGRGILDTSTVIHLVRLTDPDSLPDEMVVSAITLAELSVGPAVTQAEDERAARQQHLQLAEATFETIPFDAQAARTLARVASSLRAAGRKPAARGFDALIAAVAISRGLPLYTCNPRDFSSIDGLDVRAVPHPDQPSI